MFLAHLLLPARSYDGNNYIRDSSITKFSNIASSSLENNPVRLWTKHMLAITGNS